jgi:hypothetical protein
MNSHRISHTHLQFATATAQSKIAKEYVFSNASKFVERKARHLTMYIKNRRDSNRFKAFGSYQSVCLTESLVLRNRLLFIYKPLATTQK